MNRMSLDFMDALEEVIGNLSTDTSVGAVVITGAGNEHFSVGMISNNCPKASSVKAGPMRYSINGSG